MLGITTDDWPSSREGSGHTVGMAAQGSTSVGQRAEIIANCITSDTFGGARKSVSAYRAVSAHIAAPLRYTWIRQFLCRTL